MKYSSKITQEHINSLGLDKYVVGNWYLTNDNIALRFKEIEMDGSNIFFTYSGYCMFNSNMRYLTGDMPIKFMNPSLLVDPKTVARVTLSSINDVFDTVLFYGFPKTDYDTIVNNYKPINFDAYEIY